MTDFLIDTDAQIYLFFNSLHTPILDEFMMLFTGKFIWVPMYIAIAVMLLKTFGPKLTFIYIVAIALAITLTDQTCAHYIRPLVARLRPSNPDSPLSSMAILVNGYRGGAYGFPSCHSANSFALATFICCLVRQRKVSIFILSWATLNSYTRLYLGVHYPGDLLAGAVIGTFFGFLCCYIAKRFSPEKRKKALGKIGNPMFLIHPLSTSAQKSVAIRVSACDITIGVGIITIIYILISSFLK